MTSPRPLHLPSLRWEIEVLNDPTRHKVVIGGRRIHKTDCTLKFLTLEAMKGPPGCEVVYVNKTYRQAKAVAWKRAKAYLAYPNDWLLAGKPNENELTIPLMGGRTWSFKGSENPDDLRGLGPFAVAFDEDAHNPYRAVWDEVLSPALADKAGKVLFVTSPKGRNHSYRMFCMGGGDKREPHTPEPGWKSWRFTTREIGTVPQDILDAEKRQDLDNYRQEYEAEFLGYVGLAVHQFVPRLYPEGNILPASHWQAIKRRLTFYAVMDWAKSSGSTARLNVGVDSDGRMFFFNEMIVPGGSPERVAALIKTTDNRLGVHTEYNVGGRDMFRKESFGYDVAGQFATHGVYFIECPARLDDAVARMNDMCIPAAAEYGEQGVEEYPLPKFMVVEGTCPVFRAQLGRTQTDDIDKKTQNRRDAFDCGRMAAMMGFHGWRPAIRGRVERPTSGRIGSSQPDESAHPVSGRPYHHA